MPRQRQDDGRSPIKVMYQILQCLHHIFMLETDGVNNGGNPFDKKASDLDQFLRPAMPTFGLRQKLSEINRSWAFEIKSTLANHYRTQLDFLSGSLKAFNLSASDCAQTKSKALQWARKNFGRKLKAKTVTEFENRISAIFAPPQRRLSSPRGSPNRRNSSPRSSISSPIPVFSGASPNPTPTPGRKVENLKLRCISNLLIPTNYSINLASIQNIHLLEF